LRVCNFYWQWLWHAFTIPVFSWFSVVSLDFILKSSIRLTDHHSYLDRTPKEMNWWKWIEFIYFIWNEMRNACGNSGTFSLLENINVQRVVFVQSELTLPNLFHVLQVLSIASFKNGNIGELYDWNPKHGSKFWHSWAREVRSLIQVVPILAVPFLAILQSCRYLSTGPPDLMWVEWSKQWHDEIWGFEDI